MATSRLEKIGTIFTRKQGNENLLKNLVEAVTQIEADYLAMKDNQEKLEHFAGAAIKCVQQSTNAYKQMLDSLKEIHSSFKNEVEGLFTRGAMKPDDRPLWFDVYKAFPPHVEPKFARPKPVIKPIKQIFYEEDIVRVQFHSKGHGFGTINMLNPTGDPQIKKLVQKYNKLKSEGIPEDKLIEKSVAAVDSERQIDITPKLKAKSPESITAQVLAEADLKNIFNEK